MAFEIINRILEELNLEHYKPSFIAQGMDDDTMRALVKNEERYYHIIEKIIPRVGHAFQFWVKFMKVFCSRNEREGSGSPRSRDEGKANTSSGSDSTDSLLVGSVGLIKAAQEKGSASAEPARIWSPAPAPGPSWRLNHENIQRALSASIPPPTPEVAGPRNNSEDGEAANVGALGFHSRQIPMLTSSNNKRKRTELYPKLNLPAPIPTPKKSQKQVSRPDSNEIPRGDGG